MDQDNVTRLKEDFRFAVSGGRCRTATFINPNFAALGRYEWMEAECVNGRDWNIKTMKTAYDSADAKEMFVEQVYLDEYRGLTFGAAVLKLVEYERAQKALGFLNDEKDTAAEAGAPHYGDTAKQAGIVFNADGDPVAPLHGLVAQPGRFPLSAFKTASFPAHAGLAGGLSGELSRTTRPASYDEQLATAKIIGIMKATISCLKEHGASNVLSWGPNPFRPNYCYYAKAFDRNFKDLQRLEQPFSLIDNLGLQLNLFKFHAFRISGAWALQTIKDGKSGFGEKRSKAVVEDAMKRCCEAARLIDPNVEVTLDILDFAKASQPKGNDFFVDMNALEKIIATIQAAELPAVKPGSSFANLPINNRIFYDMEEDISCAHESEECCPLKRSFLLCHERNFKESVPQLK